jgi:hypothetical protein
MAEEKKIVQKILDPNIFAPGIPLDPWTPDLYTDNHLVQTIARLLAFDPAFKVWRTLLLDNAHRLLVADWSSAILESYDLPFEAALQEQVTVLNLAAGNTGIVEAVDLLSDDPGFSLMISADGTELQMGDPVETGPWVSATLLHAMGDESSYFKLSKWDAVTPLYAFHLKRPIRYQDSLVIKMFNNAATAQIGTIAYSYRNTFKT